MIVGHPVWLCHDVKKCRHVIHEELSEDLPDSLFSDPRISPDLKSKQSFFHSHTWTLAHIFSIPFKWKSLPGLRDHWQPTLSKIHQQVSMKANRWSVSTGWHISLFPTSCWHKNKGCVIVYGPSHCSRSGSRFDLSYQREFQRHVNSQVLGFQKM